METSTIDIEIHKPKFLRGNHYIRGAVSLTVAEPGGGAFLNAAMEAILLATEGKRVLFIYDEIDGKGFTVNVLNSSKPIGFEENATGKILILNSRPDFSNISSQSEIINIAARDDIDVVFVPLSSLEKTAETARSLSRVASVVCAAVEVYGSRSSASIDSDLYGCGCITKAAKSVRLIRFPWFVHRDIKLADGESMRIVQHVKGTYSKESEDSIIKIARNKESGVCFAREFKDCAELEPNH
jgi:hypothetical protein